MRPTPRAPHSASMTEKSTAPPPPDDEPPGDQPPGEQAAGDQTEGDETAGEQTPRDQAPPDPTPGGPPPGGGFGWPTLVRPREGRVIKGVCAGLGRATATDPVLWRVVLAVLAVFGGTGIVLYLVGWLLIPSEGSTGSHVQRLLRGQRVGLPAAIALAGLGVVAVLALTDGGRGLVPLLIVGAVAYLVLRTRQGAPATAMWGAMTAPGQQPATSPAGWSTPAWTAPGPDPAAGPPSSGPPSWGPPPTPATAYGPPPPPPPPRPRSQLGLLTVSAVGVAVGALLLARAAGADGVTAPRVLAAALLVTGVGLLAGARWGRARGLIALAVVLALALGATTSFDRRFGLGTGKDVWVVDGSTDRRLGVGRATLDLRPLAGSSGPVDVTAQVGVGDLLVLVPEGLSVDVDAEVRLGEIRITRANGARTVESGGDVEHSTRLGPPGRRTVDLDVRVGLGGLEVRHVAQ